jgi:diacylglycerol kinase (ATP)
MSGTSNNSGRAIFIVNPKAGDGQRTARAVELASSTPWIDMRPTDTHPCIQSVEEATAGGYGTLIIGGGDGTVHDVINALKGRSDTLKIAIIPLGTANDLARTLGLPTTVEAALSLITTGSEQRIDVIRARTTSGTTYLLNAATGGFSDTMGRKLTDEIKRTWGPMAYVRAAVEALSEATMYRTHVNLDGRLIAMDCSAVVIANGRYAGGIQVAPQAKLTDQSMDVAIITAQTLGDGARLAARAAVASPLDDPHVLFEQVRRCWITADPPLPFRGDGEAIGSTPADFELLPAAVRMIH